MQVRARFMWVHLCKDVLKLIDDVLDSIYFILSVSY